MDETVGSRTEQPGGSPLRKIVWTKKAIQAALDCMYRPKSIRWQKLYEENMKLALEAAAREQGISE